MQLLERVFKGTPSISCLGCGCDGEPSWTIQARPTLERRQVRKLEGVRSLDDLQSLQGNLEPSNSRLLHEMEINFYSVEASVNFVLYFMQLNTYSDLIPRYKLLDC